MRYHIDKTDKKTAYLQLYEQLKSDIISSVYSFGQKLPSKRLLSAETDVSVITVQHSLELLCDEGYVEARERSGYFVIYRESDFTVASTSHKIKHHSFNRDFQIENEFPFSVLAKTMRRVLLDLGENILEKSHNCGCLELREAISDYLARSCGIFVSAEQIIIGSGAEYLYSLIVQLLGKQRIFAIENPSYEKIYQVYKANEVKCDKLDLCADGIDSSQLKNTKASVLHITPFNSFPSCVTATASKRQEYIRWAKKRNGYIIEDNYDSELTISKKNEDTVFSLSGGESVIYLNTFSKTIAPSIRVGYMVLPQKLLKSFKEKLGFYSCTVPVFEQYVLAELINNGDFERHINRVRRNKRKELK